MELEVIKTEIPDLLIIKPKIFKDERGSFSETYNKKEFEKIGITYEFEQDNQSVSNKGVLRGLHFQKPPYEQGKLIRVARGAVNDIVVDIRKELRMESRLNRERIKNAYYGKYFSVVLSEENGLILWVPPGFAHGFLVLEDNTIFIYKCTQVYKREAEGSILWNDDDLNINWFNSSLVHSFTGTNEPMNELSNKLIISEKDKKAARFRDLRF